MDIAKLLEEMKEIEDSIFNFFGDNMPREYIEDLTECKCMVTDEDVSYIRDNDLYSNEIYGRSLWKKDGFIMAKVYNGSGEMYCVMLLEENLLSHEEFDDMIAIIEEEK